MSQIDILDAPFDGFSGHVSPQIAWDAVNQIEAAKIIDVRTRAEWAFVGVPALAEDKFLCVEWQVFPEMSRNETFVDAVSAAVADRDCILLMLCRSGARSMAAAQAMTQAGYTSVYNIFGGFEGDLDAQSHRGHVNGWKQAQLPWRQN